MAFQCLVFPLVYLTKSTWSGHQTEANTRCVNSPHLTPRPEASNNDKETTLLDSRLRVQHVTCRGWYAAHAWSNKVWQPGLLRFAARAWPNANAKAVGPEPQGCALWSVMMTDMAADKTSPWRCGAHTADRWQASGPACHPRSSLPQRPRSRLGSRPLLVAAEGDLAMASETQNKDNWSQRSGAVSAVKVKVSQCQPCTIYKTPSRHHVHNGILLLDKKNSQRDKSQHYGLRPDVYSISSSVLKLTQTPWSSFLPQLRSCFSFFFVILKHLQWKGFSDKNTTTHSSTVTQINWLTC